ncbi:uncharacterized protein L969DRAFT_182084 [Mixia osmundae IAM 14324]|uniref:Uncharacterized protein n=1 Tax=Mixia osmundae (strain CBS 9802 / IAM 14324 / JCM 22182 / KY 12970) TaxID=764103 RepID=G7DTC0_MIXOS|nr:uncharacterized protein L969DRAFT_182084 [Mixia osmundae IAM 14324]KEI42896.1 hypothetical protein L969DRAFT_182084 [Mixia osmundae IAM 14324]GAA93767.1 hypothetical protein E5Q_00413 [Mixia osmundae IAM 14324]
MTYIIYAEPTNACMPVQCDSCTGMKWRGCGRHIDTVKSGLEKDGKELCTCPGTWPDSSKSTA